MERLACNLYFLFRKFPADVAGFNQFFFDLCQIIFAECNIERIADRL